MDLSNFVTYDKKESLLLSIVKSNLDIVENTLFKPQETLEFKMNKQKESFSFDIPLELPEQWMMGVTSLEVYNTVYNIPPINNKLEYYLTEQQLKSLNVDTQLVMKVEYLYKTSDSIIVNNFLVGSYSKRKKLTRKDFNQLNELIDQINKDQQSTVGASRVNITKYEYEILDNFFEIELPPGAYELVEINTTIKQKFLILILNLNSIQKQIQYQ